MQKTDPNSKIPTSNEDAAFSEVSTKLLDDSSYDSGFETWRSKAVTWVSKKERSKRELEDWLQDNGCPSLIYTNVIEDMVFGKYVDDERMAGMIIRDLVRKKRGKRSIEEALKKRGIRLMESVSIEDFWDGTQTLQDEQRAQVLALLERKYSAFDRKSRAEMFRAKSRAWGFLMRRGFGKDEIDWALNQFFGS